jgi:hypothetical protein
MSLIAFPPVRGVFMSGFIRLVKVRKFTGLVSGAHVSYVMNMKEVADEPQDVGMR